MHLIIVFIIGGLIGFFIAAVLASGSREQFYTEEFLFHELCDFKRYWIEALEEEHDKKLAKEVIEDFMLGMMNGFRRED